MCSLAYTAGILTVAASPLALAVTKQGLGELSRLHAVPTLPPSLLPGDRATDTSTPVLDSHHGTNSDISTEGDNDTGATIQERSSQSYDLGSEISRKPSGSGGPWLPFLSSLTLAMIKDTVQGCVGLVTPNWGQRLEVTKPDDLGYPANHCCQCGNESSQARGQSSNQRSCNRVESLGLVQSDEPRTCRCSETSPSPPPASSPHSGLPWRRGIAKGNLDPVLVLPWPVDPGWLPSTATAG